MCFCCCCVALLLIAMDMFLDKYGAPKGNSAGAWVISVQHVRTPRLMCLSERAVTTAVTLL